MIQTVGHGISEVLKMISENAKEATNMGSEIVRGHDAKREDLLHLFPKDVVLVTEPGHPLYSPRALRAPNPQRVKTILAGGVLEPITVRKNGEVDGVPTYEVVIGRGRVIDARAANDQAGEQIVRIPARVRNKLSDAQAVKAMLVENIHRDADNPVERARLMQRIVDLDGSSEDDLAETIGISAEAIRYTLAVLECAPEIQTAFESDELPLTSAGRSLAVEFAKMPRDEQVAALEKMRAEGVLRGRAAGDAVKAARAGKRIDAGGVRAKSSAFVRKWHKTLDEIAKADELPDGTRLGARTVGQIDLARALLSFLQGRETALREYPELRSTLAALGKRHAKE